MIVIIIFGQIFSMMRIWLGILSVLVIGCINPEKESKKEPIKIEVSKEDPHSYSRPNEAKVVRLNWQAKLNFESKTINATATWNFENNNADRIVFDVKDIEVLAVTDNQENPLKFEVTSPKEYIGSALVVKITPTTDVVNIEYKTSPNSAALQWLSDNQTADKTHPFLFTQSQAILARTWIPCQDSPGIRFSYKAKLEVPKGLMAVMSAENPTQKSENGIYTFKMNQPIPSYLMAMAVGNFEYIKIGNQTGVYAEPSMIKKSEYEFADMQKMVDAASELYGDYDWEQFDMIILPPSFPFGGMENPRITFATPTIIAGDRSLTALVAHELAHSWSGNLVTNANWNDFWLNEGFTVYFERRIMERLYGKDYAEMLALLGYQDLQLTLQDLNESPNDTKLKLNLKDRDPDDGMSDIAYEKGYFFLRLCEETLGREAFDNFLNNYFKENKFKTTTTETFVEQLKMSFSENPDFDKVNYQEWIYEPGLPSNCPQPQSEKFIDVEKTIKYFVDGKKANNLNTQEWTTHEWLHFLRHLPIDLTLDQLTELDEAFGFTNSGNAEILAAWFMNTIPKSYTPAEQPLDSFLVNVGRRKFLTPLYKALKNSNYGLEKAQSIYEKARPNYHAVSVETMDELLNYSPS